MDIRQRVAGEVTAAHRICTQSEIRSLATVSDEKKRMQIESVSILDMDSGAVGGSCLQLGPKLALVWQSRCVRRFPDQIYPLFSAFAVLKRATEASPAFMDLARRDIRRPRNHRGSQLLRS